MTTPATVAKAALREQVRARLKGISPAHRVIESAQVCARLKASPFWLAAKSVLLFAPLPDEPDIWPLLADALAGGKLAALPSFDEEQGHYSARLIRDVATETHIGKFGIREPLPNCPVLPLNQLDLVLVPGVAFELRGRRLGRGKGFYDRLLALASGVKCGIAFDEQIVEMIPVEPHDICLDHLLTPALT
jgi:5-formyltetrahydrofolate cyclo-ligase